MNTELATAVVCYGLYDEETIIAFIAIIHQPLAKNAKMKRVSRLVVLPDYQGVGIGYKFLSELAEMYRACGYDFSIVTSAKNLIYKLYNSNEWSMKRLGVNKAQKGIISKKTASFQPSIRTECKTAGFRYIGKQ